MRLPHSSQRVTVVAVLLLVVAVVRQLRHRRRTTWPGGPPGGDRVSGRGISQGAVVVEGLKERSREASRAMALGQSPSARWRNSRIAGYQGVVSHSRR